MVLIHGLAGNSRTWKDVMPALARTHDVIAPDLMGHGDSAKPMGDYSLGSHASGLRDLLLALGVPRATIVGHSFGGGVGDAARVPAPRAVRSPRARRERGSRS